MVEIVLKPELPSPGGGGGGPPPSPSTNYTALLYRMLYPYYTPGGLIGKDDYFTLITANGQWKANTYQRLYGNPSPAPKPVSLCIVINNSTDTLTLSYGTPTLAPTNPNPSQSKSLTPAGTSTSYAVFPATDMDWIWIQGPSGADAYVVEWYVPAPNLVIP